MTHDFKADADQYTAAWDEKINDPSLKPLKLSYLREKNEVQSHFLAGAARGAEVGEEAFKRAEDERIEWVRRGERAEELCEELKAQLAEAERALKEIKVMSISSEAEQRRNGIFRDWKDIARDYFSKRGAR